MALVSDSLPLNGEAGTKRLGSAATETETGILPHATEANVSRSTGPTTVLRTATAPTGTRELTRPKRRWVAIVIVAVVAASISISGYFYFTKNTQATIQSIAVMPFINDGSDTDLEYLSDGFTETLINNLSQLPNISVKARSSVFRYKGKEIDPKKIGSDLNVQAILIGTVVQRSDLLTLNVELIDTQTENALWGKRYQRTPSDLVTLQSEIARDVSTRLENKLSESDKSKITKTYTANTGAYQLYLKGRFEFGKRTKDSLLRSIELFKHAINLDSNFALAYVGVADSYGIMSAYGYASPNEVIPQARVAAQHALLLDPDLAEAHAGLAKLLAEYDFQWAEAENEFKRAIELNPNVAFTHYQYGISCLTPLGRFDEAANELKRALELEPLSAVVGANLAGVLTFARNDLAMKQAREALRWEADHPTARFWLGFAYDANGMYAEAISVCESTLQTDPTNQDCLQVVGYAYAKTGRRREAEDVIRKFEEIAKTEYSVVYRPAVIHALLGDKEKAFAELEKSFAAHDWDIHLINVDPFVDSLRGDPRFKDLIKRMGFPQ